MRACPPCPQPKCDPLPVSSLCHLVDHLLTRMRQQRHQWICSAPAALNAGSFVLQSFLPRDKLHSMNQANEKCSCTARCTCLLHALTQCLRKDCHRHTSSWSLRFLLHQHILSATFPAGSVLNKGHLRRFPGALLDHRGPPACKLPYRTYRHARLWNIHIRSTMHYGVFARCGSSVGHTWTNTDLVLVLSSSSVPR